MWKIDLLRAIKSIAGKIPAALVLSLLMPAVAYADDLNVSVEVTNPPSITGLYLTPAFSILAITLSLSVISLAYASSKNLSTGTIVQLVIYSVLTGIGISFILSFI